MDKHVSLTIAFTRGAIFLAFRKVMQRQVGKSKMLVMVYAGAELNGQGMYPHPGYTSWPGMC